MSESFPTPQANFEKERSVKEVAEQYNIFFVHGVDIFGVAQNKDLNRAVNLDEMDALQKFQILLNEQPTISCSTVKEGDGASTRNLFYPFGVVIGDGNIRMASPIDIGTKAESRENRYFDLKMVELPNYDQENNIQGDITENIDRAITKRTRTEHNEFVIERPQIAGIYLDEDLLSEKYLSHGLLRWTIKGTQQEDVAPILKDMSEQLGLPLFLFKKGRLYECVVSGTRIEEGQEILPGKF